MINELYHAIDDIKAQLHDISDFIHTHPELALEEVQAHEKLTSALHDFGHHSVGVIHDDFPTSFLAEEVFGDGTGKVFAFFSEYDALKGIGHACGHNLIAVSGLAAFHLAVTYLRKHHPEFNGKVLLLGTPAEESYSAKSALAKRGCFKNIDASIISHPCDLTSMDPGALSVIHVRVNFHGRASHAGMAPEKGINALTSMVSLFQMIGTWRQQLPEACRVHGIITHGGDAPNVIPDFTSAFIYLRAPDSPTAQAMEERFRAMVDGAAACTGCTAEVILEGNSADACLVNSIFNQAYREGMESFGETVKFATGKEGRISTDYGNVTQLMPGCNVHFGICGKAGVSLHTQELKEAAATDYGFEQAMKCAAVMAQIGIRYLTEESFRTQADAEYQQNKA